MDNFYVILPSESSGYYYPANTIANFTTKLAMPLELQHKWKVGLVEISYPNGYKKSFRQNTIRLDSQEVIFPVKDYESMLDLITNISDLLEPFKKEKFIRTFSEYLNKYSEEPSTQLFNSCYGENSVKIDNHIVSHFPAPISNGLEDLAETIMNLANRHTSRITVSLKGNPYFITPEPVYVYTDIIKPILFGDSYVKILMNLHFPSSTAYHRLYFPLYRPVEQSFIESITIRLDTKNAEHVLFEDSDIPCVVTLHFKNKSRRSKTQYTNYNGSTYTILC